jgi:acyl-CoA synthetase (NDP forming)
VEPATKTTRRHRLSRLLAPRHIAFIGGRSLAPAIRNCEALGYDGEIWVVNPHYEDLADRPCYPSIANLPKPPDAAFVGVGRELTVDVVRQLAERRTGGCVCYAAGFAELGADGRALQDELVAAAGGMPLVGPNCYGLLNYVDGVAMWPGLHGGDRVERGVALIAQSGNISLNATMADRSLPLSHVMSIGNQAVLGLGDYIDALVDDPRVTAIGIYVEGIDEVAGFSRAVLRALRHGIPLVALKVGRSDLAAQIALSHTGSLARPDDLYRALFSRLGVAQVDSLPDMLETLKLLSAWGGGMAGRALGVLAASGGDAALVADLASPRGLQFPAFDAARATDLHKQLGDLVTIANPLDYNNAAWGRRAEMEACFTTVMEQGFDAVLLVIDYPRAGSGDADPWDAAVNAFITAHERTGRRAAVVSTLAESLPRAVRERMLVAGVVPLQGLREAVSALEAAAWYAERRRDIGARDEKTLVVPPQHHGPLPSASRAVDGWES